MAKMNPSELRTDKFQRMITEVEVWRNYRENKVYKTVHWACPLVHVVRGILIQNRVLKHMKPSGKSTLRQQVLKVPKFPPVVRGILKKTRVLKRMKPSGKSTLKVPKHREQVPKVPKHREQVPKVPKHREQVSFKVDFAKLREKASKKQPTFSQITQLFLGKKTVDVDDEAWDFSGYTPAPVSTSNADDDGPRSEDSQAWDFSGYNPQTLMSEKQADELKQALTGVEEEEWYNPKQQWVEGYYNFHHCYDPQPPRQMMAVSERRGTFNSGCADCAAGSISRCAGCAAGSCAVLLACCSCCCLVDAM